MNEVRVAILLPKHHVLSRTTTFITKPMNETLQDLSETALWTSSGKSSNECSTKPYEKLLSAPTDTLTDLLACHGHFVSFSLHYTKTRLVRHFSELYDCSETKKSFLYHNPRNTCTRVRPTTYMRILRRQGLNIKRLMSRYLNHTYLEAPSFFSASHCSAL